MPKRSGCPRAAAAPGRGRPGHGGTGEEGWGRAGRAGGSRAHPGEPQSQGNGLHGPAAWWDPARDGVGRGCTGGSGGQGWGGSTVGQRFSPPSLADPKEPQRPLAHECLGETLRILRQVINKYPLLNTLETLTAAGTLISKVKGEAMGLGALSRSPPAPYRDVRGPGTPWGGLPGEEVPHGWA